MQRRAKDHNTDIFRELAVQDREKEAWGQIYGLYWRVLVRFVCAKFPTIAQHDAEDIANEVMIALWQKRQLVAHWDKPKYWLFRVAHNQALDFLKTQKRRKTDPLAEAHEQVPDPGAAPDRMERDERQQVMKEAMARLPPETRKALMLKYLHGFRNKDIATKLRKSTQTIANQLMRGIRKLQEWMKDSDA